MFTQGNAYCAAILTITLLLDAIEISKSLQIPNINYRVGSRGCSTILRGIDFDFIDNDDDCDLFAETRVTSEFTNKSSLCILQPNSDLRAEEVVTLCMDMLKDNDDPTINAGLEVCFNFSSDRCRAANGGTLQDFINFAGNPTFRSLINAVEWKIINTGREIPGTPTRGAMKTVLVQVQPQQRAEDYSAATPLNDRQFLWTMQKERRPPRSGCWLVHECIAVDKTFEMTL